MRQQAGITRTLAARGNQTRLRLAGTMIKCCSAEIVLVRIRLAYLALMFRPGPQIGCLSPAYRLFYLLFVARLITEGSNA